MADEKKEESKPSGFDEFELEELKKKARDKKKELLKQGYKDKDAHELAILYIKMELELHRRREFTNDLSYYQQRIQDRRVPERDKNQIRDKIRETTKEYYKVNDLIKQFKDKIGKIDKKKDVYTEKDFSNIEEERLKQLGEIETELKNKDISKDEYDEKIRKKEEYFEDILKIKREKEKEEGFVDSTGALGFKCPDCGESLFESFDKNGHAVLKCKKGHGPFHPRDFYGGKAPWRAGIWKAREAEKMADAYGDRKKRLRELLGRGDINKEKYHTELDKAHKEIYGDKEVYESEIQKINEEIRNLDNELSNNVIGPEEYKKARETLEEKRKDVTHKYGPKGMKITRGMSAFARFSHTGEDYVKKVIFIVALIGIGAVISASLGNIWFFFGFLSVGLYFLTPPPEAFEKEGGKLGWDHINPWGRGGKHSGFAWIKSITKVAAIICFAYGFKSMGDIFNIFFIITCLGGYFVLKLTYSPERPGDFIESLLRFGILGCYFIPFVVFAGVFNSYVLAAIAFAFFAIPPMPETSKGQNLGEILSRGLSGQTAYYEMFDKIIFIVLMLFALIASGSLGGVSNIFSVGWQLTGTLKYTFIYFWVVALIGGFFSPARERPLTGILFLGGATIIYGIGPGSQDIGSALLGQWWPTVNEAVTSISEPISKMFGTLGKTFGDAFLLLTNPVGYATQLMNGSYANNPVGETGAYGIELSGFEVSPVFIAQPYMITANIKNSGAYNAEGVAIALSVGGKAPEARSNWIGGLDPQTGAPNLNPGPIPEMKVGNNAITISGIGVTTNCEAKTAWSDPVDKNYVCVQNYATSQNNKDLKIPFIRQNIWQAVFSSNGITCDAAARYELRKKSIPINITLSYKYQTDTTLGKGMDKLEFISQAEWDRLAKLDQLSQRLKMIQSESTSGPVLFPIGTPGLKSPILETQDFHIALSLRSQQDGGRIDSIESIELFYPKEFQLADDKPSPCTPDPSINGGNIDTANGKVLWKPTTTGDTILFCHFKPLKATDVLKGSPTKSFLVTAHANYTYLSSKQKLVKVEFGSWCCADNVNQKDECADKFKCCSEQYPGQSKGKGICIPNTQNCGSGTTTAFKVDDPIYCATRYSGTDPLTRVRYGGGKCLLGWGGCNTDSDCCQKDSECPYNSLGNYLASGYSLTSSNYGNLVCKTDIGVCCYQNALLESCKKAYTAWKSAMPGKTDPAYYQVIVPGSPIASAAGLA